MLIPPRKSGHVGLTYFDSKRKQGLPVSEWEGNEMGVPAGKPPSNGLLE